VGIQDPALVGIDPETGAVVWRSPTLDATVTKNGLHYSDPDNDGEPQIAFGTHSAMYMTR
jgi:outer membrane protein assembly factor BamB